MLGLVSWSWPNENEFASVLLTLSGLSAARESVILWQDSATSTLAHAKHSF